MAQPTPIRILITLATGTQSSSLIRALSRHALTTHTPITIHATTRTPSSQLAQDLQSTNTNAFTTIHLFQTDLSDPVTLIAPTTNVTHAFLNVTPVLTDVTLEAKHAKNVLAALAAHASSTLQRIVYTSASSVRDPAVPGNYNGLDQHPWMKAYYESKFGIEEAVIDLATNTLAGKGVDWTVLQPGTFLSNLLPPVSKFMYPGIAKKDGAEEERHVVTTALVPDFKSDWVDPECIGSFALNALLLPDGDERYGEYYRGKRVKIAAWPLTMREVVQSLNEYLASEARPEGVPEGTKVKVRNLSKEEVEREVEKGDVLTASRLFQNENRGVFGGEWMEGIGERYGVEMGNLERFWLREGRAGRVAEGLGY
ncbi:uncharacterized protein AB675_11225 [Cyphellophora attinorum]|uniref:NmrA-like domain-containing protein n=1 Tax=Cyphellophora attinorum TaxID=1664694 RepID=A0A0N1H2I1_9EURO|nr:uncharacterized protein AB675_11225 [Phialophora attinorum]KPI34333.1 hypothetical protein AB675_11225 [Phialophora attinorum]